MKEIIQQIFDNLEDWRKLPKYQLERRLDIFFTPYLKKIIEDKFKGTIFDDLIIPEFPLKKDENNQSVNVDYVMFSKNKSSCLFIELKTDMSSKNDIQTSYLKQNSTKKIKDFIDNINKISDKTKHKEKYSNLQKKLKNIKSNIDTKVIVIFLLPVNIFDDSTKELVYIDFYDVLKSITNTDLISQRFVSLLKQIYIDEASKEIVRKRNKKPEKLINTLKERVRELS